MIFSSNYADFSCEALKTPLSKQLKTIRGERRRALEWLYADFGE